MSKVVARGFEFVIVLSPLLYERYVILKRKTLFSVSRSAVPEVKYEYCSTEAVESVEGCASRTSATPGNIVAKRARSSFCEVTVVFTETWTE